MRDWFAGLADELGVTLPEPRRHPGTSGTRALRGDAPGPSEPKRLIDNDFPGPGTSGTRGTPISRQRERNGEQGHAARSDVPGTHGAVLEEWIDGLNHLHEMDPPGTCSDVRWQLFLFDAQAFLIQWGEQAARAGWTGAQLFGCHPRAPLNRYDCMGLIWLLRGAQVIGLDANWAAIQRSKDAIQRHPRGPMPVEAVLAWDLT